MSLLIGLSLNDLMRMRVSFFFFSLNLLILGKKGEIKVSNFSKEFGSKIIGAFFYVGSYEKNDP